MAEDELQLPDDLPAFDIEVITITRKPLLDGRYEIAVNHEGVETDCAIAITLRALNIMSAFDEEYEDEEEFEDDGD